MRRQHPHLAEGGDVDLRTGACEFAAGDELLDDAASLQIVKIPLGERLQVGTNRAGAERAEADDGVAVSRPAVVVLDDDTGRIRVVCPYRVDRRHHVVDRPDIFATRRQRHTGRSEDPPAFALEADGPEARHGAVDGGAEALGNLDLGLGDVPRLDEHRTAPDRPLQRGQDVRPVEQLLGERTRAVVGNRNTREAGANAVAKQRDARSGFAG